MYINTFEGIALGLDLLKTRPNSFDGVDLSKQSLPLEQINLPVTFEDASN
jgi:hypothetical protein